MNKRDLPLTAAVRAGEWAVVSGQLGVREGCMVSSDVGDQTRAALANIAELLALHHLTLSDVVKTTVYLTSAEHYDAMNAAYRSVLGPSRPARTAVVVLGLPRPDAVVEIEAWARSNPDPTAPQHRPRRVAGRDLLKEQP